MLELLSGNNAYEKIKKNPLDSLIKQTSKILKSLNSNEFLHKRFQNNQLTLTDPVIAKCYGLPKIHKEGAPLRPIISLVNIPTYVLPNIIYKQLKNCITLPHSHINNSFELKNKLKNIQLNSDYILLSLDVKSLFTNIPVDLVCESIDRRAQSIVPNCTIPLDEIKKCII